jgi:hypothetical protein
MLDTFLGCSPKHRTTSMATTLTTTGSLSNLNFQYDYPIRSDEFLFSNRAEKEYTEKSRHIPSIRSKGSSLFVIEVIKDQKINKKVMRDHTESNLLTSTFVEMKCKIMFPNSIVPRYGFLQIVKKGEQDLIFLEDCDFFISVRGHYMSHCMIELETKTNLLYTDENVLQFYSRGNKTSAQATTIEQFAYDFFVKDKLPFASMGQKVTCIKIGIQFDTHKRNLYTEATDFHMADLFVKSEMGVMATYKKLVAIRKRKLQEQESRPVNKKIADEKTHAFEDVLDTSKYGHYDEYYTHAHDETL